MKSSTYFHIGGLNRKWPGGASPKVPKVYATIDKRVRDFNDRPRSNASKVRSVGKAHQIRGKPIPTDMRAVPSPLRMSCGQSSTDRIPFYGATSIMASVGADQKQVLLFLSSNGAPGLVNRVALENPSDVTE